MPGGKRLYGNVGVGKVVNGIDDENPDEELNNWPLTVANTVHGPTSEQRFHSSAVALLDVTSSCSQLTLNFHYYNPSICTRGSLVILDLVVSRSLVKLLRPIIPQMSLS